LDRFVEKALSSFASNTLLWGLNLGERRPIRIRKGGNKYLRETSTITDDFLRKTE